MNGRVRFVKEEVSSSSIKSPGLNISQILGVQSAREGSHGAGVFGRALMSGGGAEEVAPADY